MFAVVIARAGRIRGWRRRRMERRARWNGYESVLADQAAMIDRLGDNYTKLTGVVAAFSQVSPDEVGRVHALAKDALARADHALERAGDAVAKAESLGADALARADHASEKADDAIARTEALGADSLARADHALERAGDAVAKAESLGADALARADHATNAAREALLPARITAFTTWLELHPVSVGPLVSIVLPTRDRPALLSRALVSVLLQRYESWQLVVVDDGETAAVATALAAFDNERIVVAEAPHRGLGAARNAGLDRADGEIVCYLDDDNVMHPGWLQAVAQVFTAREDVDVLYGVTLTEHRIPDELSPEGWWPSFWQLPWSRETVLEQNPGDAGALAHRRKLKEARFEEGLVAGEDWDLLIRLTADRPALAVPALSHAYSIAGEDRLTRAPGYDAGLEEIPRRHRPSLKKAKRRRKK